MASWSEVETEASELATLARRTLDSHNPPDHMLIDARHEGHGTSRKRR